MPCSYDCLASNTTLYRDVTLWNERVAVVFFVLLHAHIHATISGYMQAAILRLGLIGSVVTFLGLQFLIRV
jgi:hypothetical protein